MNYKILTNRNIKHMVNDICRQIASTDFRPDYIVGITRGGLVPALMLSHYFDVPMHTVKISLRHGDENDCETNCWMSEDAFGYDSESPVNILVVDNINDSGATLNWLVKDWQSSCLPNDSKWQDIWNNNVRFATLLNNENSEFQNVDFSSHNFNRLEDESWFVFPWEEWWKQ